MARNRIIYQSQVVEIDGSTIEGVQSVTYGLDVTREDINQFGELGAVDRIVLEAPVANTETSFYLGGMPSKSDSEASLSGLLVRAITGGTVNIRIGLDEDEGADYDGQDATVNLISGNLTSMNVEASVGAIPTVTLGFEGTDLTYAAGSAIGAPTSSIPFATQSGVVVSLQSPETVHHTHVQSATVNFDLGLEGLQKLGSADAPYVYARVPSFPATASLTLESLAVDKGMSMTLTSLKQKATEGTANNSTTGGFVNVGVNFGGQNFSLINSTLDSVSFNNAIGDNATASATFSCSIGGASSVSQLQIT
jgi:hypothetical protein